MNVVRAEALGMCFGVKDALAVAEEVVEPSTVTIHGELVHNGEVLARLTARGFAMSGESRREQMAATPVVLITAHGVSERERARIMSAGKALVDTTCPLVVRAHEAAQRLRRDGRFLIVLGRRGHVEVEGIIGDLDPGRFVVVESADEVIAYPSERLGIVCQTTVAAWLVAAVRTAVARHNPGADVAFVDTVCLPTKERQRALDDLLARVDAVVVVGGRNSNNTRELAARCRARGIPALHVESAADLDAEWVRRFENVGLTAGTSTLDETIDEVERALLAIAGPVSVGV